MKAKASNRYHEVSLKANPKKAVGYCFRDSVSGLWLGYSYAFKAACGPFGTRYDAELEVIDSWERAVYNHFI